MYSAGHSVLVYQHLPRQKRSRFIKRVAEEIQGRTGAAATYAFQTPNVVFFLAAQSDHAEHFGRQTRRVSSVWEGQMLVYQYPNG